MSLFLVATLTCWLCVLITVPRKPLPGNEVQELVYGRLLGRQQFLVGFAIVVTAVFVLLFTLTFPRRLMESAASTSINTVESLVAITQANADQEQVRGDHCVHPRNRPFTCYELQIGGAWMKKELRDGAWVEIGTVLSAPTGRDP